jgi:hypothetical protein
MTSPIEKSFEYAKTNTCTSVERVMWLLSVGLCKGTVFVPVLPLDIDELKFDNRDNWQEHVRKNMGLAGAEIEHLSGHEWSSHWASLEYVKLSEFVVQIALVTTV